MLAALMATCAFLGYEIGRLRPVKLLIDWNWRRAMWGNGKRITNGDGLLWMALHPVLVARTWHRSPWYREPKTVKPILLNPDFFKGADGGRANA